MLNVSDLVDRRTRTRRSTAGTYPSGDLFTPAADRFHRNLHAERPPARARLLLHDERPSLRRRYRRRPAARRRFTSNWCSAAYGTTSGLPSSARPAAPIATSISTFPAAPAKRSRETHSYYWARQFAQWLKPSLDALGVLPSSASNYPRVLMISDACRPAPFTTAPSR